MFHSKLARITWHVVVPVSKRLFSEKNHRFVEAKTKIACGSHQDIGRSRNYHRKCFRRICQGSDQRSLERRLAICCGRNGKRPNVPIVCDVTVPYWFAALFDLHCFTRFRLEQEVMM